MSPSTGVEVLANPMRGRGVPPPTRDPSVRRFHRRFPDYATTPLVDLPRLAEASGIGRLLVKDESNRLGLPAFKMLGASWASYRALSERLGQEPEWSSFEELATALKALGPMSLSTATDGNHGRAVASFARRTGLGARIFVPDGTSPARIEGIRSEGATCEVVNGTYEDAVDRAAEEAADDCLVISDTSWPGYETVPRWVIDGYATIFDELDEQVAAMGVDTPDAVVIPIGVGAFAAAAGRWYRGRSAATDSSHVTLIGVEPTTAACLYHSIEAGEMIEVAGPHHSIMAGLNCGRPSPVAWPTVSYSYDWFTAIDDDVARLGMRELAADGIVSGETGAAATGAILALTANGTSIDAGELGLHPDATVIAISTEGATDPAEYERIVGHPPAE